MSDDPLNLVGTTLAGKYAVKSIVQEGGFGVVYRGVHLLWKHPVAIKAFKAVETLSPSAREALLEGFIREGALLAELSERSMAICQARDVGTVTLPTGEWVPYLVLEWLEGNSLEDELASERAMESKPWSLAEVVETFTPVVEALELAHARGICHLDLKPGNLFVRKDDRGRPVGMKLLDFGIAKTIGRARSQASRESLGGFDRSFTPGYAAPEQWNPDFGSTGAWTDVFSLALILGECISGKDAIAGETSDELYAAVLNPSRRPTPRNLGAQVSDDIERVFERALDVDPRARYATAGEMWQALRVALRQGAQGVLEASKSAAAAAPASPPSSLPPTVVELGREDSQRSTYAISILPPAPRKRRPMMAAMMAAALFALAGVVGVKGYARFASPVGPHAELDKVASALGVSERPLPSVVSQSFAPVVPALSADAGIAGRDVLRDAGPGKPLGLPARERL